MEARRLGTEGPELTIIGFGCWAMGGAGKGDVGGWGPQDDRESVEAIQVALHGGVNWFDTAAAYGLGHSEEVLGGALASRRSDIFIATKFGLVWDDAGHLTNNSSYDSVRRECDASLKRLQTDYIDLYQQHWPDQIGTPFEETMRALEDLVQAGKVRYIGVSNFDRPMLENALTIGHLNSLQPQFSIFHREVEAEVLPFCQAQGIGVVAYSPLASGLLGGNYTTEKTFLEGDWRAGNPDFTGEGLRRNLEKVDQLRRVAERFGKTVPQLAIAWVLSNPAITAAIVGVRRPAHIQGALPAADWHLDVETLREIEEIMQSHHMA